MIDEFNLMSGLRVLQSELKKAADNSRVSGYRQFFKTKPGQYGFGDKFLGLSVPQQRKIAANFYGLSLLEIKQLLNSPWHEFRLTGLIILTHQYQKADLIGQTRIARFYLDNLNRANNWDLIDLSAAKILGAYLLTIPSLAAEKLLFRLASSNNLWERRAAIVSTYAFIKEGRSTLTFKIAKKLFNDQHDLIHKATGWMLRETGKHCGPEILVRFLDKQARVMPRTTLRYALEHFSKKDRKKYLSH